MLQKGSKYILFLRKGLDSASEVYFSVGMDGGRYNVDGTDKVYHSPYKQAKMRDYAIALYKQSQFNPSEDALIKLTDLSKTEEQLRYWAEQQLFRTRSRKHAPSKPSVMS